MLPTVSKTNSGRCDWPGFHSVGCNSISQSKLPEQLLEASLLPKRPMFANLCALPSLEISDLRTDGLHMSTGREETTKGRGTRLQKSSAPVRFSSSLILSIQRKKNTYI